MKIQKMTSIFNIILLIIFFSALSCSTTPDLEYNFDSSLSDLYIVSHPQPYAIQLDSNIVRKGSHSVRFEIRDGDVRINKRGNKSFRAELSTEKPVKIGSEQWYFFSLFIPSDFPIEDNRLVIGQWYAPSDSGEKPRSPAMALRFKNGKFYISMRTSHEKIMKKNDGNEVILFQTKDFILGKWNDFLVDVKWNHENGFVKIWLNKNLITDYKGPVGYNDDLGPSFQFGIYRDKSKKTYVIYFDEFRRGRTRSSVEISH